MKKVARLLVLLIIALAISASACRGANEATTTPTPAETPKITTTPKGTSSPTSTPMPIAISWESMNGPPGGRISKLIQNLYGRHELYALTVRGIYKSENKGESWQLLKDSDSIGANSMAVYENTLFVSSNQGAYYYNGNNSPVRILNHWCNDVTVSDNKLFVVFADPEKTEPGILYTDLPSNGFRWNDISPSALELHDLRLPTSDQKLWHNVSVHNIVALGTTILANIVAEVEGSGASTNGGLYISEDSGSTWHRVNLDVPKNVIIANIVQDPGNLGHILLLLRHAVMTDFTYPVSELIWESEDGGKIWSRVTNLAIESNGITDAAILGSAYYLSNPYSGFILKLDASNHETLDMPKVAGFGDIRFTVDSIMFDIDDTSIVYGKGGTAWGYGLVKSVDGMKTWQKMDSDIIASGPVIVVPDSTSPDTVFTEGNTVQEKYCSRDGGKTWEPFSPTVAGNELRIDPHNPNHMILINEMTGIYESYDRGKTFNSIAQDFSSAKVFAFAVAQDNPDKIYVSNIGVGISEYQGSGNWRYMTNSPDYAYDIKLDPENSNILYATYSPKVFENYSSIWRYSKYQQENYGWTEILRIENSKGITSLEFDESNPNRIYAGVIGEEGTIYVSNDKGNTWSKLNEGLSFTTIWGQSQLQIDPRDKNTVYAGTWGGGTYKTTNGGTDWLLLDGNDTFWTAPL